MPKKIIDLVREKTAKMEGNSAAARAEAEANAKLAAAAMMGGRLSLKWREYMMQFVEKDPNNPNEPLDPNQLARLLGADNTLGDPDLDRKRAYLLSNKMCGGGSPGATTGTRDLPFDLFVESIDHTLPAACPMFPGAEPNPPGGGGPGGGGGGGQ